MELMACALQHPEGMHAPAAQPGQHVDHTALPLGPVPHMVRGQLSGFSQMCLVGQAFSQCTACSPTVVQQYRQHGWSFLLQALQVRLLSFLALSLIHNLVCWSALPCLTAPLALLHHCIALLCPVLPCVLPCCALLGLHHYDLRSRALLRQSLPCCALHCPTLPCPQFVLPCSVPARSCSVPALPCSVPALPWSVPALPWPAQCLPCLCLLM